MLKKYSADFIGIQETKFCWARWKRAFPTWSKGHARIAYAKVAEILQRLVSEDISVRNLRTVLEALIEWGQKKKTRSCSQEYVRAGLKRHISHKYASSQNIAACVSVCAADAVRGAVRQTRQQLPGTGPGRKQTPGQAIKQIYG